MTHDNNVSWIWNCAERNTPHQYCWFGREFQAEGSENAALKISSDSDFIVYLNGHEIGRGQFPDHQDKKTFATFDLSENLRRGNNLLQIFAYHCGENFFSHVAAPAGIWAEIQCSKALIETDHSWRCCPDPVMQSGPMPKVTFQLGFTTQADFRNRRDFLSCTTLPADWTPATVFPAPAPLRPRPVKALSMSAETDSMIIRQGQLIRSSHEGTFAEQAAGDYLQFIPAEKFFAAAATLHLPQAGGLRIAAPSRHGIYLTIDAGREEVGILKLRLQTAPGTIIDIAHGEHLDDGRVRCRVGERNFADRLICGAGITDYELPFRRLGARYLELHIPELHDDLIIYEAGLRPISYPMNEIAPFRCSDYLAEHLDALSVRTLRLCMQDHFEDCPWREQGLYAYDTRNQALYGYTLWGNYDYTAASLRLLGEGLRSDGWLELCAPAKIGLTIPIFSFAWIASLHDHYIHSGTKESYEYFRDQLKTMMRQTSELFDEADGLYRLPAGSDLWHFYEWVDGLDRADVAANPITGAPDEKHCLFNLYWLEAIDAYSDLCGEETQLYKTKAAKLRTAIHRNFYDPQLKEYATFCNKNGHGGHHLHTQILALRNGVVPPDYLEPLTVRIINGDFGRITFSAMPYLVQALMPCSPAARSYVANLINQNYSPAAFLGATSMWETDRGGSDFAGAASLCHGWSSLPAYFYRAWMLGVRPLSPGYRTFSVSPYCGSWQSAAGEIMTPSGAIKVQWQRNDNGITIELNGPENLTPVYQGLPEVKIAAILWNGKNI